MTAQQAAARRMGRRETQFDKGLTCVAATASPAAARLAAIRAEFGVAPFVSLAPDLMA